MEGLPVFPCPATNVCPGKVIKRLSKAPVIIERLAKFVVLQVIPLTVRLPALAQVLRILPVEGSRLPVIGLTWRPIIVTLSSLFAFESVVILMLKVPVEREIAPIVVSVPFVPAPHHDLVTVGVAPVLNIQFVGAVRISVRFD